MPVKDNLKKLGGYIADLVFPISCLICWKEGCFLCDNCQPKLSRMEKQLCLSCQKPAPYGKTHPDCLTRNTVDGAVAALNYKDPHVRKIIETFKYNFVSDLAVPLAAAIAETLTSENLDDFFSDFIIVPVPLHSQRFNWRGFNQAELLASALAEKLKIKIDNKLIHRNKFTRPQVELSAEERQRNMDNAFNLVGDAANKKILLVDDVVTSGSTAAELAKLLKRAHASEVWIVTAAHG